MYTRSHGRFPRGMRVPENYSGNAFRTYPEESLAEETNPVPEPIPTDFTPTTPQETKNDESVPTRKLSLPKFQFSPGKLLSRFTSGGIGTEELLLIGLILLLAEEGKNDDLILLLILLLFIS